MAETAVAIADHGASTAAGGIDTTTVGYTAMVVFTTLLCVAVVFVCIPRRIDAMARKSAAVFYSQLVHSANNRTLDTDNDSASLRRKNQQLQAEINKLQQDRIYQLEQQQQQQQQRLYGQHTTMPPVQQLYRSPHAPPKPIPPPSVARGSSTGLVRNRKAAFGQMPFAQNPMTNYHDDHITVAMRNQPLSVHIPNHPARMQPARATRKIPPPSHLPFGIDP